MNVDELIEKWSEELRVLRDWLYDLGDQAHTNRYNLLATEALRLSLCINDARAALAKENAE